VFCWKNNFYVFCSNFALISIYKIFKVKKASKIMNIDTLIKEMENIFNNTSSFPNILYHYCGSVALLNFIRNQELYLSDIRGMNDYSEMSYGKNLINKIIDEHISNGQNAELRTLCNDKLNFALNEPFIFCLSAEEQLLSQWINYADHGRGFAVGFNTKILDRIGVDIKAHTHLGSINSRTILSPVIYDNELQYKLIQLCIAFSEIDGYKTPEEWEILAKKTRALPVYVLPPSPFLGNENKLILSGTVFQQFKYRSIQSNLFHLCKIFKDKAYEGEKEYRIIKTPNYKIMSSTYNFKDDSCDIKFRCDHTQRIIPYLQFKWEDKTFLNEIIFGPDNTNEDKHIGVLLDEYGFNHVKLRKSNIPYKNYNK
jgi:hypothetical protein